MITNIFSGHLLWIICLCTFEWHVYAKRDKQKGKQTEIGRRACNKGFYSFFPPGGWNRHVPLLHQSTC